VVRHREPLPVRLQVPAAGIDAPLVRLGLDERGALEVPQRPEQAGWFGRGARPGERGAAVIAGHVDSAVGPAAFYRLGALHPGDAIRVHRRDGSAVGFRVRRVERWPKARFPTARVYGATQRPSLRLITCGGAFDAASGHYVDNTIVFAVRG
jgi:sortase (surface protein transpeptidase)